MNGNDPLYRGRDIHGWIWRDGHNPCHRCSRLIAEWMQQPGKT
jgi:hypothetical protein